MGKVSWWDLPYPWNYKLYTALLVAIGFILMALMRVILYNLQCRHELPFSFYLLWCIGELILFSLALAIASFIITNGEIPFFLILFRAFLDVVSVLLIPYIVVSLVFIVREKNYEIKQLSEQLNDVVVQEDSLDPQPVQANLSTTPDAFTFYDRSGRFVFSARSSDILYVESADNYCNIHYLNDNKEDHFILHNSLKNVNETYGNKGLMRCHRCYMVNVSKVKFVKKTKDGLVLELYDTDRAVPVSKTYNDAVVHYFVQS